MTTGAAAARVERHLRPRGGGAQETTSLELFFDLVYVLAVTQLSHLLLTRLDWTSVWHMTFLLLVVWWAWIYTTWMTNWLDPGSTPVRLLIVGVALASLLMAAAIPEAFDGHALLFAAAYVGLQVGRNLGGALLLRRDHPLGDIFVRLLAWSCVAGVLWLAGALVSPGLRIALWGPALVLELAAPLLWYWIPGRGRVRDLVHPIEGSHFAERCQGFVIIALGESVVVTGATAAQAGLSAAVVGALAIGFLEASALWWLYFGEVAVHSRRQMENSENAVELARDAYTYLHLPIVAGVILTAVATDFLVAHPGHTLDAAHGAVTVAGPVLYLFGELLFRLRMIHRGSVKRTTAIIVLIAVGGLSTTISAAVLSVLITAVLIGLAIWEYEPWMGGRGPRAANRSGSAPAETGDDAPRTASGPVAAISCAAMSSTDSGRVALVTGGARGIGAAIARGLAQDGMTVAIADIRAEQGRENARRIEQAGGRGLAIEMDVRDPDSVTAGVARARGELGEIEVLVNVAGWDELKPFVDSDEEFWQEVLEVNFKGGLRLTHALLPSMIERRWGRIVNISSDAGRVGSSLESVYAGAKGAIISFTKTIARETARLGVTANIVCPGPTDTEMLQDVAAAHPDADKVLERLARAVPMKRLGKPDDVAAAVRFFASDAAGYITGQTLSVSGGLTMA